MTVLRTVVVVFLLAACGNQTSSPPPSSGHVHLFEAVAGQIAVIDTSTHVAVRHLPLGVPSPDWKHLYSLSGNALLDTDSLTGSTTATIPLPGRYQLPPATYTGLPGGMSPDGRWLVVESYDQAAGSTPTATHFLIVDTHASHIVHTFNLTGYFQFDAISNDGMRLYLIEYLNAREYYVRLFDVAGGALDANIVVDKANGEQSMSGLRLSGIATPGGDWLFSMYVRENDNPFVHALSLDGPFAFCLDLPGNGYGSNAAQMHWSIAMDSSGDTLFAVNGATGVVAQIDNSQQFNPQLKRTAHVAGGQSAKVGSNAAVLSADGRSIVVAGSTGLMWIDTGTLQLRTRLLPDWHIWSIALAPDGKSLYAASDTGQIANVDMREMEVAATFDPAVGRPIALMRAASL